MPLFANGNAPTMKVDGEKQKVVLVPGNGMGGDIRDMNFYGWAEKELYSRGFDVRLKEMPDPVYAREKEWIPFILNELGCDEDTVLVGHSSGAAAGLRIAEKNKLRGLVLIAPYDTDMGDSVERESGYFNRAFDWEAMRRNCGFIVQFSGARDRLVPLAHQLRVKESLGLDDDHYFEFAEGDHFFCPPFPELVEQIEHHLGGVKQVKN